MFSNHLEQLPQNIAKDSIPEIKHETLCNDFKAGGYNNINVSKKIIALQSSW